MTKQPDATFHNGGLKATIWKNESKNGQYYSTKLSRSYQDKEGEWQETNYLRENDLLHSGRLLTRAHDHIQEQKQERGRTKTGNPEQSKSDRKADFAEQRTSPAQNHGQGQSR